MQACLLHLIRNTFRYASRRDWDALGKQLRPIYTAPTAAAAADRFSEFSEFTETWAGRYPAIVRLWQSAWDEFIPFLDYDVEIRRIICSTNAIESLNARYRRAVEAGMLDGRVLPLGLTLVEAGRTWCLESDPSTERENAWHGRPVEVTS